MPMVSGGAGGRVGHIATQVGSAFPPVPPNPLPAAPPLPVVPPAPPPALGYALIALASAVSAVAMASVWIASLFRAALGASRFTWFSSSTAKSRTLRRPTSLFSMASATGGGAPPPAPPLPPPPAAPFDPPVPGVPGTKLLNRLLYWPSGLRIGASGTFSRPGPLTAGTFWISVEYERHFAEISPKSVRLSEIEFA